MTNEQTRENDLFKEVLKHPLRHKDVSVWLLASGVCTAAFIVLGLFSK